MALLVHSQACPWAFHVRRVLEPKKVPRNGAKFWVFLKQLGTEIFACLGEIMERTLEHMDFPVQVENIL